LGHSPVSYMVFISFVNVFKPPSPSNLSTSPGTSSSPVAFQFLISLITFSTSLCKIYGPFSSVSTSSTGSASWFSGRLFHIIWAYNISSYIFRLTLKKSSGSIHNIKNGTLTMLIMTCTIRMYSGRYIEIFRHCICLMSKLWLKTYASIK
jgi:hypothetical protein